jgi:hypothetical protein
LFYEVFGDIGGFGFSVDFFMMGIFHIWVLYLIWGIVVD